MVETDAPYLAPGKFRGKRNEPSYVVEIAKVLAETRGVSLQEISRQTTEKFFRPFSKGAPAKATTRSRPAPSSPAAPRPPFGVARSVASPATPPLRASGAAAA